MTGTRKCATSPFLIRHRPRSRDAACSSGVQVVGLPLFLDMLASLLDRGMLAGLGKLRDSGGHRVQINRGAGRQQRFLPAFTVEGPFPEQEGAAHLFRSY